MNVSTPFIFIITLGCGRGFEYPEKDDRPGQNLRSDSDSDSDADSDADADADADSDSDTDADSDSDSDSDADVQADYELRVTPRNIAFGSVSVSGTSSELVHIRNIGLESVHLNGIGVSDPTVFEIDPDFALPVTLSPGMERSMLVDFSPSSDEHFIGEITFITEEPLESDVDMTVQGTGDAAPCDVCAPIIDVNPPVLNLDALLTCEASGTVTVSNDGDRPLNVTAANIVNDSLFTCGSFTRSWGGPRTVAPGASMSITVTYRATSACFEYVDLDADWNILHILSNDSSQPDSTVGLNGAASCVFG
jgi:hypothetical protein